MIIRNYPIVCYMRIIIKHFEMIIRHQLMKNDAVGIR